MNPNTELTSAPANDAPKLRRYAAIVRGDATVAQNSDQLRVKVLKKIVESGSSTTMLRYTSVYPIVSPNPGRTFLRRDFTASLLGLSYSAHRSCRTRRRRQRIFFVPCSSRRTPDR